MSQEVRVFKVNDQRTAVDIDVMNVRFHFYRTAAGKIGYSKSKPEAQVYDASQLWVPDPLFKEAIRQAAAILTPRPKKEAPITRKPPAKAEPIMVLPIKKAGSPQLELF